MNDDRSRGPTAAQAAPDPSPRESWLERLLHRLNPRARDTIRDDLEDALAEAGDRFSPQERAMLKNVLGLHRIRVDDVMVPRADIVAVPAEISLGELLATFRTAGHSRLPVYGETLDDPKGMIHIRDFLDFFAAKAEAGTRRRRKAEAATMPNLGSVDLSTTLASAKILRPVLFVPGSMPAVDLLVRMQATRTHMALVIDEYGGTDGLVSIEDLVEIVVGDIEDEHDVDAARLIVPGTDETLLADARVSLEEASEALGVNLSIEDQAEEVETLGGLVVTLAGRVPSRGEIIAGPHHLEFEVADADPRRIKRLRIHRREGNGVEKASAGGASESGPPARAPAVDPVLAAVPPVGPPALGGEPGPIQAPIPPRQEARPDTGSPPNAGPPVA